MQDSYPSILSVYYTIGEKFDSSNITRSLDSKHWASENHQEKESN
jgi:hypothetical protein